ncbi:MAG: LuxR C-terminal-related transcriptional regulator [Phycisphaerales bacterium]
MLPLLCMSDHPSTAPVTELEFRAWAATPLVGIVLWTRDEQVRWCNEEFAKKFNRRPESLVGIRIGDYLPSNVLKERRELWRPLLERGERVEYSQFFGDRRMRTRCAPLHTDVLGPDSYIAAFFPEEDSGDHSPSLVASVAILSELRVLSPTELRVAHAFAKGLPREEIAKALGRSPHTIQVHFRSIFAKMGIHREVDLALRLGKSGLGSFSFEEWERIVGASIPQSDAKSDRQH